MEDDKGILEVSGSTVLDGTGYGFVRLIPAASNWHVTTITMRASDSTSEGSGKVYVGYIGDQYLKDTTSSPSTGDTSPTDLTVTDGISIWFEWTDGTPGATATATITGERTLPKRGFRAY